MLNPQWRWGTLIENIHVVLFSDEWINFTIGALTTEPFVFKVFFKLSVNIFQASMAPKSIWDTCSTSIIPRTAPMAPGRLATDLGQLCPTDHEVQWADLVLPEQTSKQKVHRNSLWYCMYITFSDIYCILYDFNKLY